MKLITRNQVFEKQNNIAKLIRSFQKDFFDEEIDESELEMFDILEFELDEVEYESFIIEINHSELETYTKHITEKLMQLLKYLNVKELNIISHLKLDFYLNSEHIEYEKVLNCYKKLNEITNSEKYDEAISVETSEIETLVEIFFWIERCNGGCPEFIFWSDIENRFCFYFCKYGKLHFIDFTNGNLISTEHLKKIGFNVLNKKCSEGIMLE
jgi:hypothetical protein